MTGAERWIKTYPERIFIDKTCSQPLPVPLPNLDEIKVHRIVIAQGAKLACKRYFNGGSGSLMVMPSGLEYPSADSKNKIPPPFTAGIVSPDEPIVHVLDEANFEILLSELDTIIDLTNYLDKKETFLRGGQLKPAHGEEDLIAIYSSNMNAKGEHDFVFEGLSQEGFLLDGGFYSDWISHGDYFERRAANEISYTWDRLISTFTHHMMAGTSLTWQGVKASAINDIAVRKMAQTSRFQRRNYSKSVLGALEIAEKKSKRFFRTALNKKKGKAQSAFIFLAFPYLPWMKEQGGYQKYRRIRTETLSAYMHGFLVKHPSAKWAVGIAFDPPAKNHSGSEDVAYLEQHDWSDDETREILEDCRHFQILQGKIKYKDITEHEYPSSGRTKQGGNRKSRRVAASQNRKSRRRRAS